MRVEFAPEVELRGERMSASVMWPEAEGRWPRRGGRFPAAHPCFTNEAGFRAFHNRGYLTGLYWQGDGFSIDWTGLPAAKVARDLEECFGWVIINRNSQAIGKERRESA